MIDRDLLRFGPFNLKHANHLAVSGHAISAEVRRRRDQKDVLLLFARESAIFQQDSAHQRDLGFNQVGSRRLRDVKIGQEADLFPHGREGRKIFLIERRVTQVRHGVSPKRKRWGHYKAKLKLRIMGPASRGIPTRTTAAVLLR